MIDATADPTAGCVLTGAAACFTLRSATTKLRCATRAVAPRSQTSSKSKKYSAERFVPKGPGPR